VDDTPERRVWDERRPKRQVEFTNNSSIYTYMPQTIYTGRVSVFDKCLHWPRVSVKKIIYTAT
jgi:hypothetical protein